MGECCFCGKRLSAWTFGYAKGSLYDSEGWVVDSRVGRFKDLTMKSNVTDKDKRLTKYWLCGDCRPDYLNLLGLDGEPNEYKTSNGPSTYETKPMQDLSVRQKAAEKILEKTNQLKRLDNFAREHVQKMIKKMESECECVHKWEYMSEAMQSYWRKFGEEHPEALKHQIHIFDPAFKTIDWTKFDYSHIDNGIHQARWMAKDNNNLYMTMFFPRVLYSIRYSYELRPDFEEKVNRLYQFYFYSGKQEPRLVQRIPLSGIVFFYKDGDVSYTTETYGGGGSSFNVSGAVKGAILAGPVGAYIGGHKDTNPTPYYTKTKKHDNRCVILRLKDSAGGMKELKFSKEMYEHFMTLIPEKEISYIQSQAASQTIPKDIPKEAPKAEETAGDPIEKIKGLKNLLDLGAITQEEYDEKKKQLLDSIK